MPYCILRYCKNHSRIIKKYSGGVTFHKFPRHEHGTREQWIKFVQRNRSEYAWLPAEHTCICSDHFREEDCYITKTGRRFLKKSAVPYENPKDPECERVNLSPTSLERVDVSDSDSIFDSPRKIQLKKDLRKMTEDKKKYLKKIQKLKRQCRYLKSKNKNLTDIVKKLKSCFPVASIIQNENELLQEAAVVEKYINGLKQLRQPIIDNK